MCFSDGSAAQDILGCRAATCQFLSKAQMFALLGYLALAGAPPGPETVFNDAGYIQIKNANGTGSLFYWMFESRNNPATDPFVFWMSGGPGCSGQVAMFGENGPYIIQDDLSLKLNPYSWNTNATVLWIDQPVGAGFSYGEPPVVDENQVANDVYNFLEGFFEKYQSRGYQKLPFFVFGESYAGHYVPAVSSRIVRDKSTNINFAGAGIGNGLTEPLKQFPSYPEYVKAYNGWTKLNIKQAELDIMEGILPLCKGLIEGCNDWNTTLGRWEACLNGYVACSYGELLPIELSGVNLYDVRMECPPDLPLCYNFSLVQDYLNEPTVQKALGVSRKWQPCNRAVDLVMVYTGDWMVDFEDDIAAVLDAGHPVLIYAGEYDYICNWIGNKAWTDTFSWSGKAEYAAAPNQTWTVDGQTAGTFRAAKGLTFIKVRDAGHMVPRDQPRNSLDMLNRHLFQKPFARA
eukprot:m.445179 g.445179  ORF g.445179 m.445179 type:complete len:460 (-) comp19195_c0_seq1:99-1478(-)